MVFDKLTKIIVSNPVVVFSKSNCRLCEVVKQLLRQHGASFEAIELDYESDGAELQSALYEQTRMRTVPNVFIGWNHVGGSDEIIEMNKQGDLLPKLIKAGAVAKYSS